MSICKTIETISTTSTKFSYGYYKQTINCVIKTLIVNEWIQTRRTKDMSMNVNTTATTYGNYQNNYQTSGTDKKNETTKSTKTTETKKSSVESLGEENLSRAAQKVLKDLRGSRNDMDFYVADFENGDNAKDILSRSDKEFTVIFSKEEMEKMLRVINQNYDIGKLKEFSYELGRIDTIDEEKLEVLKNWNVDRISINPQTFNMKTLKEVNRYHDQEKFDRIFNEAKRMGFIVNMDLILGLPGETTDDILYTLQKAGTYDMDNLTIHNLAIKKTSGLNKDNYLLAKNLNYKKIYGDIYKITREKGLYPYYMYRQKNSFEWGENIGYSLQDKESVYNIETIEENKTIIGIGAGAVTKLINGDIKNRTIERLINPKDPLMWIDELEERLEKKKERIREAVNGR